MIFKNMLGRVLQGLSNFSPVKNLIKYILDRSLNELLSDQISLQDFKNGELLLTNIGLNLQKINKDYLLSSPYILHQGRIRKLRVTLPGWSELSTKSIEVAAEGLQVDLKPNKSFADNFKEAMREQSAEILQQEQPGELDESNPMDFFRQLVKQIILNMKIKVENSVVRLFINEPTGEPTAKPQYYLMLRLPLLTIGKSEQAVVKEEGAEQIKFDIIVPQLSVHLLKEGSDLPEYANEKVAKEDFPFTYPPVHHPSTILLVGQPKMDKEKSTKLTIKLTTFFKKQKKTVAIQGKVNHIEATLDPIQLKILSRFLAQVKQFQRILKTVMAELGLAQVPALGLSRRDSRGKSISHDLFSSIMISISQQKQAPSTEVNLYNSMMQSPEMLKAAAEFNQNAAQQLRNSGSFDEGEGWKNINFKQELKVAFALEQLQANFPKYVTASAFERHWAAQSDANDKVNESLGCSHFRLSVRGVSYTFSSGSNVHEVRLKVVRLQDARLKNQHSFHHSVSEEFYELDSSTFENTNVNQDYFTRQPQLIKFRTAHDQHYCLQQLFRLSEGQQPQVSTQKVKTYAFMPCGAQCGQGAGLAVSFNADSKSLRVEIKEVAVMVNFQIGKDVLNILYPVFLYRKLYERMNLQAPQMAPAETQPTRNMDLFQSQYRFSGMLLEQAEGKEQRLQVRVRVGLVYCFYREAQALKTKQNLIEQVQRKILDSDNFSKNCFCELNERGIYAQIHELQWQQVADEFNLSLAEVKAGLLAVQNSKIEQDVKPILIVDRLRVEESRAEVRRQGRSDVVMKNRTFVPRARFGVELPVLISFIDMAKRVVAVVDSLQNFKRNLSAKLLIIQQQMTNKPRNFKEKVQRQRVVQVLVGEVQLRMLLISTYLRGVYFVKKGGEKDIKLDCLAVGLAKKMDVRLGQFKNQLLTQQYPLTEKYPGIKDTHLILEAGRDSKQRHYGAVASEVKNKRRLQRRLQFFESVEREGVSVWVILKEKTQSGERRDSRAFRFDKARKNSIIQQQKRISDINILPLTLHLHAANLAFLLQHKQEIEDILREVGRVMEEIREESKDIIQRKDSVQSEGEATSQIIVKLSDLLLNIDIRPDYECNPQTGMRVLSNSRMFAGLRMQRLAMVTNPDSKTTSIDLTLTLNAHFLHYLDKDVELNPLLLSQDQLEGLGFRRIFDLADLIAKISINGKSGTVEAQCSLDSVKFQLCLTSIPLLQIFLDHFLNHCLNGDFGYNEEENFIVLQNQTQEEEPEDLTQKLQEYEQLLQEKRKAFNEYSNRQFAVRQSQRSKFVLKFFKLGSLSVKLLSGNEFKFLEVNSLYESKATQRARSENPEVLKYLGLSVQNIRIKADQTDRTRALVQLQRLELLLSYKRKEGLLWGAEKDCSVHLLRVSSPLKILAQIAADYLKLKLNSLEMTVSLTDEVFTLAEQFSKAAEAANSSSWKRQYGSKAPEAKLRKMLLMMLPQGRITATAEFKRTKLLSERVLKLQELVLHQEQSNERRIAQIFHDWGMSVFTSNLGTLVSGALFQVLSACIGLLFGGIKQLMALFVPRSRQ